MLLGLLVDDEGDIDAGLRNAYLAVSCLPVVAGMLLVFVSCRTDVKKEEDGGNFIDKQHLCWSLLFWVFLCHKTPVTLRTMGVAQFTQLAKNAVATAAQRYKSRLFDAVTYHTLRG